MKTFPLCLPLFLAACTIVPVERPVYVTSSSVYQYPAPASAVISIDEDPPLWQPEPIATSWAPPPMIVETRPAAPSPDAIWIGGYWAWNGTWAWARGRWAHAPRSGYYWVHPYYENRGGEVVFIRGYWSPPHAVFTPPPAGMRIKVAQVSPGVVPGPRPVGPSGVFVPAPPGSRPGIIVPAPIGIAPSVVASAPPAVGVGMRIQHHAGSGNANGRNMANLAITAPPSAVATGQELRSVVPAQAHLASVMQTRPNFPPPGMGPLQAKPERPDAAPGRPPILLPNVANPPAQPSPSPSGRPPNRWIPPSMPDSARPAALAASGGPSPAPGPRWAPQPPNRPARDLGANPPAAPQMQRPAEELGARRAYAPAQENHPSVAPGAAPSAAPPAGQQRMEPAGKGQAVGSAPGSQAGAHAVAGPQPTPAGAPAQKEAGGRRSSNPKDKQQGEPNDTREARPGR